MLTIFPVTFALEEFFSFAQVSLSCVHASQGHATPLATLRSLQPNKMPGLHEFVRKHHYI